MKKIQSLNKQLGIVLSIASVTLLPLSVAVLSTGCAGDRYHQSTGEYVDDHELTSAVKGALRHDSEYKFPDVQVETFKGVVQLSGFTNTKNQKNRAGELAKSVPNVKEVENNITVKE